MHDISGVSPSRYRSWIIVVWWSLWLGLPVWAQADGQRWITAQEWRMETLNPGQAASLAPNENATDWQPLSAWHSWGFGREAIWIRLKIRSGQSADGLPLVLRVRPAFLDDLILYDPAMGHVMRTGDNWPPAPDAVPSLNFGFILPTHTEARWVYLRLQSTSSRIVDLRVLPLNQAQSENQRVEWLMATVLIASGIFAIWATLQWHSSRERVMGLYALKQSIATLWAFFFLGFARLVIGPLLPPGVLNHISSLTLVCVISVTIFFFRALLESYNASPWMLRLLKHLAVFVLLLPLLLWSGHVQWLLWLANLSVIVGFGLMWLTLVTARPQGIRHPLPMRWFSLYLAVYATLNALPSMILLKWLAPNSMVLLGSLAHPTLDVVVMFTLLQIRARGMRDEQTRTQMELELARQHTETEKRHHAEKGRLLTMLAHEIKTPLASMQMWTETGQWHPEKLDRAITDMGQIIDRCTQTGQLEEQGLSPNRQWFDAVELTQACVDQCREPHRVQWQTPPYPVTIHTDTQMLSIVLSNLLDNACKYGDPGRTVQLDVSHQSHEQQPGWLWKIINPIGPVGVPNTAELFQKYYRSPKAHRVSGSGLGLFLVKGLVELLQGRIDYLPHDGQIEFRVWLPQQPSTLPMLAVVGNQDRLVSALN